MDQADQKRPSRRKLLLESRREREFYRYYEPIRALSLNKDGPPLCDPSDAQSVKAHRPFSSPDRALTAFCQLGAYRLNARRAMMLFFDTAYAYILAEATRSLSLEDDSVHGSEDSLWMGHSVIPREYSICEHTVNLPLKGGSNADDESAQYIHIINDLKEDTRFCDRPYVTGGPLVRAYFGVPITTPKGINIGAYCILDDRPRQGLDQGGITFMRDMAATVMNHLEMVRAKAEHDRGTQMVAGLSAFIEGASASSLREQANPRGSESQPELSLRTKANESHARHGRPSNFESLSSYNISTKSHIEAAQKTAAPPVTATTRTSHSLSNPTASSPSPRPSQSSMSPADSNGQLVRTEPYRKVHDPSESLIADNALATYQRAAQLIRDALGVETAAFYDGTVSSFGGLVDRTGNRSDSEHHSDSNLSNVEANNTNRDVVQSSSADVQHKHCRVLGSSVELSGRDSDADRDYSSMSGDTGPTETFLRSLLRRYPHGKVWNFNEEGYASSDDESGSASATSDAGPTARANTSVAQFETGKKKRKRTAINDGREIQRLFPGVRSLALVGMWDYIRERWSAGCVTCSYSPLRLLSYESEINYLHAFCDVIMAEVHRIEVQNADTAKMDFISSISHELRSPLHGILGSVECLQEQPSDFTTESLLSQIDICGRTLLDVIDHLLDFSKINSLDRKRTLGRQQDRRQSVVATGRSAQLAGLTTMDADVPLDVITEEVVETTTYSFWHSRARQAILDRKVSIILDVDRSTEKSWKCHVGTGAWKRICINLLTNALKYTEEGYVRVSLSTAPSPQRKRRLNAVLTVEDSGRGMSKDFLENHLFKPFSQEDNFMEGTGLGLSLVTRIVKALSGRIAVESEKGVGTKVLVTIPLERSQETVSGAQIEEKMSQMDLGVPSNEELPYLIALVGPSASTLELRGDNITALDEVNTPPTPYERGQGLLLASIQHTCKSLSYDVLDWEVSAPSEMDLMIVLETELSRWGNHGDHLASLNTLLSVHRTPIIVICNSTISERRFRSGSTAYSRVQFIAQPTSKRTLAKAIEFCMQDDGSGERENEDDDEFEDAHSEPQARDDDDHNMKLEGRERVGATHATPSSPKRAKAPLSGTINHPLNTVATPTPRRFKKHKHFDSSPSLNRERSDTIEALDWDREAQEREIISSFRPAGTAAETEVVRVKSIQTRLADLGLTTASSRERTSLLLVDDNRVNLELLVRYAEKHKYQNIQAHDGRQAVDAYTAATIKPQVILIDINMPVLNGFEATRKIRQFEQQEHIEPAVIIALTGLGSADAQQEAYSSGVDLFLTKPVRLKDLTSILEGVRDA